MFLLTVALIVLLCHKMKFEKYQKNENFVLVVSNKFQRDKMVVMTVKIIETCCSSYVVVVQFFFYKLN